MHPGRDEVRLDLAAERLEQIAGAPHLWYIKICESLYAQGLSAICPDPGA
jgi:hypothetical protein